MKYFASIAALIAAVKAASLGNTNYETIAAGQPFTFSWYDASGEVTIDLRNGESDDLKQLLTITSGQSSTNGVGSFTWTVPTTLEGEGPYAVVITDSSGVNYSPQFPIAGVTVGGSTTDTTTATSATATASATTVTTASTTHSSITAQAIRPTSSVTFEFQSSSSVAPISSTATTLSTTRSATPTRATSTSAPTTIPDGEGKAAGMASPLAFILVSVAAMFYLQ